MQAKEEGVPGHAGPELEAAMKAEAKPAEEAQTGETQHGHQQQPAAGDAEMADADAKPSTSLSGEAAQEKAGPSLGPDGRPAKKTRQGALLAEPHSVPVCYAGGACH